MKSKSLLTLSIILFSFLITFGQAELPILKGDTKKGSDKKSIPFADIKIMKAAKVIGYKALDLEEYKSLKSDKKGNYKVEFEFNNYYRIICEKEGYVTMFFDVDARLPKNKKAPEIPDGIDMELNFFTSEDGSLIKLELFEKNPIEIWRMNPTGNGFKPDLIYRAMFQKGVVNDKEWAKEEKKIAAAKKAEEEKKKAEAELAKKNKKHFFSAKLFIKGNTPLPKTKVLLYKENPATNPNAQPVESAVTNAYGKFTFKELKTDEAYYLAIEGVDDALAPNIKVKNKNGSVSLSETPPTVATGGTSKMGIISFTANQELFNNFEVANQTILIAGNILVGDKDKAPLENVKVLLKDAANAVVQTTRTNALGGFAFTNIDPDQKYLIAVDEADPALVANKKVSIVNKAGQEVYSTTADASGKFKFEVLPEDKVHLQMMEADDSDLSVSLKGKLYTDPKVKTPLKNAKIYLFDQNGKAVKNTTTDGEGTFVFENIASDVAYLINLDENDPTLKTVTKVYLENDDGSMVKEITKDNLNKFTFEVLQTDFTYLQKVEVEDPWLDIVKNKSTTTTIAEPIYFKAGDDHILNEATVVLNKVAIIMKAKSTLKIEVGSHTDATGSDAFNMELSKKRAKAAVDYLISKGVNPNNVKGVGYGETKLKNNCGNNVKCTEAEHSQNRRIEFKILAQ